MKENVPACVGIIMDGNRRWARLKGKLIPEGHKAGYLTLREIARCARDAGVKNIVAYAFSAENWNRAQAEVEALIMILRSALETEATNLIAEKTRIRFIGDCTRFSEDIQTLMKKMEEATSVEYENTLYLALSYGGHAEIIASARAVVASGEEITEESITRHLWTAGMPDPDIIIRTGGEKRLSGFLPWQTIYSELFFTDTLWPDFSGEEFVQILNEYQARKRNFGK